MIAIDRGTNLTGRGACNELQGVRISLSSGVRHVGQQGRPVPANNGRRQ